MTILSNDIYISRENGCTKIWLKQSYLLEKCNELSDGYLRFCKTKYKKGIQCVESDFSLLPNNGKAWRWGKINGNFFYDYDLIPNRNPRNYKSKLPTRNQLLESYMNYSKDDSNLNRLEIINKIKAKQKQFIDNGDCKFFMYECEVEFSLEKARELMDSLAWLKMIRHYNRESLYKKLGLANATDFYKICSEILTPLNLEGLKINTGESLRKKVSRFPKLDKTEQRYFVVSGKYGNTNRKIVGSCKIDSEVLKSSLNFDFHETIMYDAWMNPFKPQKQTKKYLYDNVYVPKIKAFGLAPIKFRTFCHHLNSFSSHVLTTKERDGSRAFNSLIQAYTPSKPVKYSNSMWVADGSGTKLAYGKYFLNKATGQYQYKQATLYMIKIFDVASKKIVGYSIGTHETPGMVQDAIKMAVMNNNNAGCLDFLSDNGSSFKNPQTIKILNMISKNVQNIKIGNSQENPAEMFIKMFTHMSRKYENWTSLGFNSNSLSNRANPDYFNRSHKLPSLEQAIDQLHRLVEEWNSSCYFDSKSSPNQLFKISQNPKIKSIDERTLRYLFGHSTITTLGYQRSFVNCNLHKKGEARKKLIFEIPDYHNTIHMITRKLGNVSKSKSKVKVHFDEEYADLYTMQDVYIMTCPRVQLTTKSISEQTHDTISALHHHKRRKDELVMAVDDFRDQIGEAMDVLNYELRCKDSYLKGTIKEQFNEEQNRKQTLHFRSNYVDSSNSHQNKKNSINKIKNKSKKQDELNSINKKRREKLMLERLGEDLNEFFNEPDNIKK